VRTVKLYGELGRRFGRVHRLAVKSPAEAIRAIEANRKGLAKFMREADKHQMGFRIINGRDELDNESRVTEPSSGVIKIVPVVIGSGALTRVLVGAVLIVASFFVPIGGSFLFAAGVGLALGGVAQMISPPPKADGPAEKPENKPSYTFNGPVNTTAQGHPVPVGYGRLIVGGAVISGGITIEQQKEGFERVKTTQTVTIYLLRKHRWHSNHASLISHDSRRNGHCARTPSGCASKYVQENSR
jgi:predicted phage tail protein